MERKILSINEVMDTFIRTNYVDEINEHENSTKENQLCNCDWETQGLCHIGRWLGGSITSYEFLEDTEWIKKSDDEDTIKNKLNYQTERL